MLRKLSREPLLHFLALGLALFLLFDTVSSRRGGADRRIVVNDATVANIVQLYERVRKRPPTSIELQGLIDSHVREEILFREGVAMGLDRDDPVIRRRVQQKMTVIAEESDPRPASTNAELEVYLSKHAERYFRPAIIGFDQVVFDPARHRSSLEADLAAALAHLRAGAKPDPIGDSALLPATIDAIPVDLLGRDYGDDFATTLVALPLGAWRGPIASGYGMHLVRINTKTPGRPATLAEVRSAVERDFENDRRLSANEAYSNRMRAKYDVVIDVDLRVATDAGGRN